MTMKFIVHETYNQQLEHIIYANSYRVDIDENLILLDETQRLIAFFKNQSWDYFEIDRDGVEQHE